MIGWLLVMTVTLQSGTTLVEVRMPYSTEPQCVKAAADARWVIPADHGLEVTAECRKEMIL